MGVKKTPAGAAAMNAALKGTGQRIGGRQKGTLNKTTASVKSALVEAFERLGGVDGLVEWGRNEPAEFYKLWVKVLPVEKDANTADQKPFVIVLSDSQAKEQGIVE